MVKFKRAISVLLIIFFVFSTLASNVYALENNNLTTSAQTDQSSITSNTKKVGKIIRELTDERTQNTKRFQKDDGTFEVVQYAKPVHYLDNGKWKNIDNTLENVAEKDANGNSIDYLQNKQNDFSIKISKDSTAEKLIDLQKGKYNISWNLSNAELTQGAAATLDDSTLNDAISRSADEKINKDRQLSKATPAEKQNAKNILVQNANTETLKSVASAVNFPSIYPDVDLQYILNGSDVKENILLNKITDKTSFDFNLNATNVIPVLQKDKSIIFYDSSDKSKPVFKMQAPFMYDKAGNDSTNIEVILKNTENGYVLSLMPDKNWINSSDRVFPVTIDPSLQTSLDVNSIHDTFVS